MPLRAFLIFIGCLLTVVAVLHLTRLLWPWDAVIAGWTVPHWFSYVGFPLASFFAYVAFHHARRSA